MLHRVALPALACFFVSTAAVAASPLLPTTLARHGVPITQLRDLRRLALFGTLDTAAVQQVLGARGMRLTGVEAARDVTVVEMEVEAGGVPSQLMADGVGADLLNLPGVTGWGPVFYEGQNATVPTGRIWVYLPRTTTREAAVQWLAARGLVLDDYVVAVHGIALARPAHRFSLQAEVERLVARGLDAEPELMRRSSLRAIPTDTYFARQWYLRNTGDDIPEAYGAGTVPATAFADCRASDAWDITTGSPTVRVAVIDSGTDCTHPELQGGKCADPYNAISNQPDATPPTLAEDAMAGHGTSVAGIIAAPIDATGMVGVCPACTLVPIRLIQSGVYLTDAMMLRAFKHAVDSGAAVINNSWGPAGAGDVFIPVGAGEREGLEYAATGRGGLGTLVVYAAGNESSDTRYQGQLRTGLPNVMAVAATNQFDMRSVYSNFGLELDLAAPSNDLYLTPSYVSLEVVGRGDLAGNYTNAFGGTSAAAPVVSGIAALVLSANGSLTAQQVRDILRASADKVDPLGGVYDAQGHSVKYGYGRVNAYKAVLSATGSQDPACTPPASTEDCASHRDDNCDGWVDEGCTGVTGVGVPCSVPADCGTEPFWQCPSTGKVRGLCTWSCFDLPCPSGTTCVQGRCAVDCSDAAPCAAADAVCTDDLLGVCLPSCADGSDCAAGETCDPSTHLCRLDTDGHPGSPCTSDECLGSGATCLTPGMGFPDGYCTHACTTNFQCEDHGKCVATSMGSFCYAACSFDGDCRPGYLCEQAGPRAGTCYKVCDKDAQCTGSQPGWENIICDVTSGRCIDTAMADGGLDAGQDAAEDAAADAGQEAGAEVDAPLQPDAATPAQDAATQTPESSASDDGGCDCHMQRPSDEHGSTWVAALVAAWFVSRRRR